MFAGIITKVFRLRNKILLSLIGIIATLSIIGWIFKINLFTGSFHNFIPIAPLTAILFLLISLSLYIIIKSDQRGLPVISKVLLFITLGIASMILIQHIFRLSTDIERIFGNITQPYGNVRKGRMSHVTSILFILTTLTVLLQYNRTYIIKSIFRLVSILVFAYTFLLVLGYAYTTPFLYSGNIIPVAFLSSISFLLINLVIIDQYKVSFVPKQLKLQSGIAIQLAKAFLPVSLLIVIIHSIIETNIKFISTNPAIGSFVLLLVVLVLLFTAILFISGRLGISIEKLESEKLQIQVERQEELKRQNEEYYALYEEYKTTNEELYLKNEELSFINIRLEASEKKYHSLFDNMLNGFAYCKMIYDNEGEPVDFIYLEVNKAFQSLTGLKNVVGKKVTDIIPGIRENDRDLIQIYGRVALNCIPEKFETYVEALNMWFSISVFSPEKEYFVAVFDVITKRKMAELALEESQKQLFDIIDNMPALVYVSDKDGKIVLANTALAHLFGITRQEIVGKTRRELLSSEFADEHRKNELEVMDKKQPLVFEETNLEADGIHTYYTIKFPLFNSIGNVYSVCGISVDITDRKNTEEQLRISKEKAEESDRLKTAFLQNMSHEIRTPMNAIMGFAQLLPEYFDNREKIEFFSEIINQRSSDLLEIINEILDISKIESGQLSVHFEKCNILDLFKELSAFFITYRQRLNKENIDFVLNFRSDLIPNFITTDESKLKQVLINLINNAFKFTTKGKIEVGLFSAEEGKLLFYVSDTGIGIADEDQSIIFNRFTQLSNGVEKNHGGTGLGLAIVKGIIDFLKEKIWLESKPNEGSTFYFTFPYTVSN